MNLLEFLRRESKVSLRSIIVVAVVAGLSNALVLAIINVAASQSSKRGGGGRLLIFFVLTVAIYAVGLKHFMVTAISEVERILDDVRIRLADKIRRCDLGPLEEIGRTRIYASISKDTTTISQAAMVLVVGAQASVLIVFTAFYVAWLSPLAFVMTAVSSLFIATAFLRRNKALNAELHESMRRENLLFDTLTDLLSGFKEVRLNRRRSDDLYAHYEEVSHSATQLKVQTMAQICTGFILSQVSFYLLLGVTVFVVPRLSSTNSQQVVKITAAVLFLAGPLAGVMSTIPTIASSNAATENIVALEAQLDHCVSVHAEPAAPRRSFKEISFESIVFHYDDRSGSSFTVGPIDLKIHSGEIVFIAGGNGSGKSTFLKLLTALYFPQQGVIRVDGKRLTPRTFEAYRSLFATVFTDFHLFSRLYGLYDLPAEEVDRRIELIEMTGKARVVDSTFDTLDLSGGQRKRLALLISMLEDRPIYVFDEVAADQDPSFRRKFYQEILPLLKRAGKTVVAVTHDDKYFGDADRLLKMDEGRIVSDERAA
jgi:putative pyoverdin transport system ATP-binding/permease protein